MAFGPWNCFRQKARSYKISRKERQAYSDFLQNITAVLQGKSYILAISLPQRYFEPLPIIKMLEEAGLKLQGIICATNWLLPNSWCIKAAGKNLKTNYYDETKLQNTFVDLVITTAPKKCSRPQYCIGFRRVGRKGSENFCWNYWNIKWAKGTVWNRWKIKTLAALPRLLPNDRRGLCFFKRCRQQSSYELPALVRRTGRTRTGKRSKRIWTEAFLLRSIGTRSSIRREKLKQAIAEACAAPQNSLLAVLTSCSLSLIGDDIKGVCATCSRAAR